jgi:hypothetical protein
MDDEKTLLEFQDVDADGVAAGDETEATPETTDDATATAPADDERQY